MKNFTLNVKVFILTVTLFCLSCTKSSNNSHANNSTPDISLEAPSGFVIAQSLDNLGSMMKSTINRKFQTTDLEFKIKDIHYTATKSGGTIAEINYLTSDKIESNLILMFNVKEKVTSSGKTVGIFEDKYTKKYSGLEQNKPRKYSCSGSSCCKVHALEHPDGSVDVDCSCSGCTMTIE